ncbi:MAG TPA: hypothetical protein DDW52_22345 [Planctomycetaceae bacterium]|nr:hypothetical protein [Planctomycetaceae bacterium]
MCFSFGIIGSPVVSSFSVEVSAEESDLRIATFEVDATPELGSPLAYDPMVKVSDPLRCKGVVLLPTGDQPIVLATVDWLGVANESNAMFCGKLAEAVGTQPNRVVVHALHQHDAPRCDHSAAALLEPYGIVDQCYDLPFIEATFESAATAAKEAIVSAVAVSTIQVGQAPVQRVASNRRMLDPTGQVHITRYTACRDPLVRALPLGVIDPALKLMTFEDANGPVACLTFYATHPQSYYRVGAATPDFPGLARDTRQKATGVFHMHFNGAGGNIGAGKYNDGSQENRPRLARRVEEAMQTAWENRRPDNSTELNWQQQPVVLPISEAISVDVLAKTIADETQPASVRCHAAEKLAFAQRDEESPVPISRLAIGNNTLMFMPGELFVEYQLAAQAMVPEKFVMMAAYGDYGTAYIGTRVSYSQGGYEVSPRATNVSPKSELVLLQTMRKLLEAQVDGVTASDYTDATGPGPINVQQLPGEARPDETGR